MSARQWILLAGASAMSLHAMRPASSAGLDAMEKQQALGAYDSFRRKFRVERPHEDQKMYEHRMTLFHQRSAEVQAHNSRNLGWVKAVNKFADFTEEERHGMLGTRLSKRGRAAGAPPSAFASSFVMIEDGLAETVDYRQTLNTSSLVKDQGSCGSCWAVAVAGAMEMHAEASGVGTVGEVSYEQLVDCVQNPQHCGGTGGCEGATTELAFEYIAQSGGIAQLLDYTGYQHGGDGACSPPQVTALTATGFVQLPENEAQPLRAALANHGPVAVSADASNWFLYESGVFNCHNDWLVNHAILMVGYGEAAGQKYWLIRNSWGADWGENGFIRLVRHEDSQTPCGIDTKPEDGTGCDGGPPEITVCGSCGILADSAYPTGVQIANQL